MASTTASPGRTSQRQERTAKPSARQRILRVADELFFNDGLFATGVNRIIQESGVAKASFYAAFRSKDDLIDAYLEGRHRQLIEQFDAIEGSADDVLAKINRVFDLLASEVLQPGYRGCLFLVASAEIPQDNAMPARRWVRNHKLAVRDCFWRICSADALASTEEIAEQLMILYEGALATAAVRPETSAVERARAMSLSLVEKARGDVDSAV